MKNRIFRHITNLPRNTATYRVKEFREFLDKFLDLDEPETKRVMLFRHAESVGNVREELYGVLDYPLTEKGKTQALTIQPELSKHREFFDSINSSELQRAIQTGGIALDLGEDPPADKIKRNAQFNEFNFGALEGISCKKMRLFEHEFLFQM